MLAEHPPVRPAKSQGSIAKERSGHEQNFVGYRPPSELRQTFVPGFVSFIPELSTGNVRNHRQAWLCPKGNKLKEPHGFSFN
jgi:hypothetical protein